MNPLLCLYPLYYGVSVDLCVCSLQAQQMLSACLEKVDVSNTEGYDIFIAQLKEGLKNTSHETAANHKVAKVSHTQRSGRRRTVSQLSYFPANQPPLTS